MWKNEFKRLFLKKQTILIILILVLIGAISFYTSFVNRQSYIQTFNRGYDDIDPEKMKQLISHYNGIKFNLDFYLTSDYFQILTIILFLYCGIFLAPNVHKLITSGQENFFLSREKYSNHLKSIIKAQSIYIFSIVLISFAIITIIGFITGGYGDGITGIGLYNINLIEAILIIIFQTVLLSILLILVNGISLMSNVIIKNKLIIQCVSFVLFMIAPMIISSTIGNIITPIGEFLWYFVPFNLTAIVYWLLQYNFEYMTIICGICPLILYAIIFKYLFKKNVERFSNDCI